MWLEFKTSMMNQFSKSVNYPFKLGSQGTCQLGYRLLKVLGQIFKFKHVQVLHSLGWRYFLLWLCADPLGVIKEALQGVDLSDSDGEHDKQVEAGPEGHLPQVVLQKVAVPRL